MEAINLMGAAVQTAISQDKKKRTGSPNVLADKYEKENNRDSTMITMRV